jgi:hypothetical protein
MTNRIRILLLSLAVAIGAAILLWPERELPPQPVTAAPAAQPAPPVQQAAPAPLTDAELADRLRVLGVLLPGTDTSASFVFASVEDSSLAPQSYGLIPLSSVLDSTFRVDMIGSDGPVKRVAVANRASIEDGLRQRVVGGCEQTAVNVPLAESVIAQSWIVAFRAGAAQVVPRALDHVSDSLTDLEANRLADLVAADTTAHWVDLPSPAQLFANVPVLPQTSRFTIGNDEFMLVEAWRSRKIDTLIAGQPNRHNLADQRLVIAERKAGSQAPFTLAWSRYAAFEETAAESEAPLMVVRIGPKKLPAIVFSGAHLDGVGGMLVARLGPGRWVTAVSWYAGC